MKKLIFLFNLFFFTYFLITGSFLVLAQSEEYEITKKANQRLLPKEIQDDYQQKNKNNNCRLGLKIGDNCLLGNDEQAVLLEETEKFQPVFVPDEKVISVVKKCSLGCQITNFFAQFISPQTSQKETGSLNAFRPESLAFESQNSTTSQPVSSEETASDAEPEAKEVKDAYIFSQKMLLPYGREPAIKEWGELTVTSAITTSISPGISPAIVHLSPTPLPVFGGQTSLLDFLGSVSLKNLIEQVGRYYGVPPAIIAAVSWIEGRHVWFYSDQEILNYSQEGVKDPINCKENSSGAAGPMQFIQSTWEGYQYAITKVPGYETRIPQRCNILDSFYAAGSKLKNNSATLANVTNWDKKAVANAGRAYYGTCAACNPFKKDPDLNIGNYNLHSIRACVRLGMSYCEYLWYYYQCNEQAKNETEFSNCLVKEGLLKIR